MTRRRLSWGVRALLFAVLVANGVLVLPYLRALWWLHAYRTVPAAVVLPVRGASPQELSPSFGAPRYAGPHEGIDIVAPFGTPVVAAAGGVVIGNRPTAIGGNVVWLMGAGRRMYYYAHLRELAPGMHMGRFVTAGEQIGTVGDTGNAVGTPPHLHFAIYLVTSWFYPLRHHAIDPYPILVEAGASTMTPPAGGAGDQRSGR